MIANLIGKWKLLKEGSDVLPGIDKMIGTSPLLKLLSPPPQEFFLIEQRKIFANTDGGDEISLSHILKGGNVNMKRSYVVGMLNFESMQSPNDFVLGFIQNCDEHFTEFTLVRMGPKCGQNSRETYKLDKTGGQIKVCIDITISEGVHLNMVKYLLRMEDSVPSNITFTKSCIKSQGWKIFEFWSSSVLSSCSIMIIKALKVETQYSADNKIKKLIDVIWTNPLYQIDELNLEMNKNVEALELAEKYGEKSLPTDGVEVIKYVLKVTLGQTSWFVTHRYTDYDGLRRFLLSQNPFNTAFKEIDSKFPGKAFGVSYRKSVLENRIKGLEEFITYFLVNARYCRQNSIDALCSFLEMPENLQTRSKVIQNRIVAATQDTIMNGGDANPTSPMTQSSVSSSSMVAPKRNNPTNALSNPNHSTPNSNPEPGNAVKKSALKQSTPQTGNSNAVNVSDLNDETRLARITLLTKLSDGMTVIKYGRQGAPKKRILRCDEEVSRLFWSGESDQTKSNDGKHVTLSEVIEVRLGSDIDPATSDEAIAALHQENNEGSVQSGNTAGNAAKRKSLKRSILMQPDKYTVLHGTATLRRKVKPEDLHLCFSLILSKRTFDIQCLTLEDFEFLYHNLKPLCGK